MRILFLGDVVGKPGREIVKAHLPRLKNSYQLDAVVINAENAAGGFGITASIVDELTEAGGDVFTLGNHAFDQSDALTLLDNQPNIIRPTNFPPGTVGKGSYLLTLPDKRRLLVINVQGRIYMGQNVDDPFRSMDEHLRTTRLGTDVNAILVDMHAEATSEKQALGHYLDGRVSVVVGTHTHTPTADDRILAGGTAYLSDAGMCGNYDSVLGMDMAEPIHRFLNVSSKGRFEVAKGAGCLCGLCVETNDETGAAVAVSTLRFGALLKPSTPSFW